MAENTRLPSSKELFFDLFWYTFAAPVVPPASVTNELMKDDVQYVDWENDCSGWINYYRTEFYRNRIVTRLRNGSVAPVTGWLSYTPPPN